jgi:hypothetical protein
MFGSQVYDSVVVSLDHDPGADDVIYVWRAPKACEVKSAYAATSNAVAADATNYFDIALYNGGAAGTATTLISGTVGGTAGWTALLPVAFTMTTTGKNLAAGDVVTINYNENGTGTFTHMIVQLDVQYGT